MEASKNSNVSSQSDAKRPHLDSIGARLYAFLARKLGYSRTPKPVPLFLMAKAIDISYMQARYRVSILIKMGLLERWTVKHPTKYKITYYRLTWEDPFLEESRLNEPPDHNQKPKKSGKKDLK